MELSRNQGRNVSRQCALLLQIRFELVQAADSSRFSTNAGDRVGQKKAVYAAQVVAALAQAPGRPVPLEEQVLLSVPNVGRNSSSTGRKFSWCDRGCAVLSYSAHCNEPEDSVSGCFCPCVAQ